MSERSVWFRIGEILVSESKSEITPKQAIEKIREYMQQMEKPEMETCKTCKHYPPEKRWIPCSGLPKEKDAGILKELGTEKRSEYAIVTVEVKGERMTSIACTYDGKWNWKMKYAFPDYKVVAWMPLPEPYKVENEEV